MPSRERVQEMVEKVQGGEMLAAFEEFYADDVVMRENVSPPTVGKDANREREKAFVGSIVEIHENCADSVVVDGDHVAIRWKAAYTLGDGNRYRFDQVALQTWRGDRIVEETFFYDPTSLVAA